MWQASNGYEEGKNKPKLSEKMTDFKETQNSFIERVNRI